MRKSLERRLARLERRRENDFVKKLEALALRWRGDPEAYRRAVRGHEAELDPDLGPNGTFTWFGYLKLRYLLQHGPVAHLNRSDYEAPLW